MKCQTIRFSGCLLFSILLVFFGLSSCYYDSEEYLYSDTGNCDTQNVTYSNFVGNLMQVNCNACHSQASPSGGIITSDYENLMVIVNNGKLQGTINHLSGFSPMPKGQNKLPDCDLQKIDAWINDGSPE